MDDSISRTAWVRRAALLLALCAFGAMTIGIWWRDRQQLEALEAARARTTASLNLALNQAKEEIQGLTGRLNALTETRPEPSKPGPSTTHTASPARRKPSAFAAARDPRIERLQGQLADTRKELAQTRDDVAKAQESLDGKISSTRDDLNGSIARTHDEVVVLQKRGEQTIHEFHLGKSKDFERVGPMSLSLRSTSQKRKTYDLIMLVDDFQLGKKHVNLYEPVWITLSDRPQPVELVVNRVGKNEIAGYISEPKYKKSELAAGAESQAEQLRQQQLVIR